MILPLHVDLSGMPALVIGGGPRASRWVYPLIESGAKILVLSEKLPFELAALAKAKRFKWLRREFQARDLAGQGLVVAASEDSGLNQRALRLAQARKLWAVSADPRLSGNAWQPPSLRRGGLLIHFGLPGAGRPGPIDEELGSYLKRRLSRAFGREWELVWEELARLKKALPLKGLLPAWLQAAKRGRLQKIRRDLEKMLRKLRS